MGAVPNLKVDKDTHSDIRLVHGIEVVHILEVDCGTRNCVSYPCGPGREFLPLNLTTCSSEEPESSRTFLRFPSAVL